MVLWDFRHPHEAPACLVNGVEEGMAGLCQLGPKNPRRPSTPPPQCQTYLPPPGCVGKRAEGELWTWPDGWREDRPQVDWHRFPQSPALGPLEGPCSGDGPSWPLQGQLPFFLEPVGLGWAQEEAFCSFGVCGQFNPLDLACLLVCECLFLGVE